MLCLWLLHCSDLRGKLPLAEDGSGALVIVLAVGPALHHPNKFTPLLYEYVYTIAASNFKSEKLAVFVLV